MGTWSRILKIIKSDSVLESAMIESSIGRIYNIMSILRFFVLFLFLETKLTKDFTFKPVRTNEALLRRLHSHARTIISTKFNKSLIRHQLNESHRSYNESSFHRRQLSIY
ncbi:uncharacterized protein LOC122536506 [Frieseomelitta varia]|uniref:uncharacterized protein LOC122536506 n=1 Tax=Frieseomelitta varia TaxID=561572 RepID=UPI001CB6B5EE|nr:uncharacterized protein LOC122536506 [Frieseomelitta varia]